jgi:hypothetical protein
MHLPESDPLVANARSLVSSLETSTTLQRATAQLDSRLR